MKPISIYDEYYNAQEELEREYGSKSIVLMMVGSFYEMYGVDTSEFSIGKTQDAHNILGMNMTLKNKSFEHSKTNPYMVGFPDYALDEHLGKFLKANYTVALYDQFDNNVTDSFGNTKSKGKCRYKTKVYTPSTYIDDSSVDENSLLLFDIIEYKSVITKTLMKKVHIVVLTLSTGKTHFLEAYDSSNDTGKAESELYRIIHSYNPSELIYCGDPNNKLSKLYDLNNKKIYFKSINPEYSKESYQSQFLNKIYGQNIPNIIDILGLTDYNRFIPYFITALQFAFEQNKLIVSKIQKPQFIDSREQLILNNDSIYQLNLVPNPFEINTCLLDIICKARTNMGKRCLKQRLLTPTTNIKLLKTRYKLIGKIMPEWSKYDILLRGIADIEKKYRKMVLKTIQPYEIADLADTWSAIKNLLQESAQIFNIDNNILTQYDTFMDDYWSKFNFKSMKKSKLTDIKGTFFHKGANPELDLLDAKIIEYKNILKFIANSMSKLIDSKEGEDFFKLESTDKEGWYISTTKTRFKKLPTNMAIKFVFNNKEYVVTHSGLELVNLTTSIKIKSPEIRKISKEIYNIQQQLHTQILEEYLKIIENYVNTYGDLIINISNIIADIDFIVCGAKIAVENGYTKPIISNFMNDTSYFQITGLRHPIIEQINNDTEYTTNDIDIGLDEHYGSIVYGLNMSGKSSLLKAIGCNIVMAQIGYYVSCKEFVYYPFRNLLSKMSIRDNMSKGQSTFMVELLEINNMLMRSDQNTLVLSDELCSSTESTSAHAIVAQTLSSLTEKKAKFLFSTHLHGLQKIQSIINNKHLKIYHFKVHIDGKKIIFDRHIEEGGMTDLYGLEVARAIGLPDSFMRGAFAIRDILTEQSSYILTPKPSKYNKEVYVHECEKCGSMNNLHTHHIIPQSMADSNKLIDSRYHKNKGFNLMILCEECHQKEHHP
jgi:DNA mismatch repair protein MutS